jgi:hypothetical protein
LRECCKGRESVIAFLTGMNFMSQYSPNVVWDIRITAKYGTRWVIDGETHVEVAFGVVEVMLDHEPVVKMG